MVVTNNYFRIGVHCVFFDSACPVSTFNAFGQALVDASATGGTVSVWRKPAVSGEWDAVPVIGARARRVRGGLRLVEGGRE